MCVCVHNPLAIRAGEAVQQRTRYRDEMFNLLTGYEMKRFPTLLHSAYFLLQSLGSCGIIPYIAHNACNACRRILSGLELYAQRS